MVHKTLSMLIAAVVLTGCAVEEEAPKVTGDLSLYQRLANRETLTLEPTSLVGVVAYDETGSELSCIQPTVRNGQAMLRGTTDGLVIMEALDIALTDVKVDADKLDGQEIVLSDIRLRLGTQLVVDARWGTGWRTAVGGGQADLLMDWSAVDGSGQLIPLATQKLPKADFAVNIYLDYDGSILADIAVSIDGELGNYANRISLSDFSMAIQATSSPPNAPD